MAGNEGEAVDCDKIVVFERIISGGSVLAKCWRIIESFPTASLEEYQKKAMIKQEKNAGL